MKSDICKLLNDGNDVSRVLKEVEKCSAYGALDVKPARHMRLLAEELVSMLPELLKVGDGEFWMESNDACYELHVSVSAVNAGEEMRQKVLGVSSTGKNAAARGITGKIRAAVDLLLYPSEDVLADYSFYTMGLNSIDGYVNAWSLDTYSASIHSKNNHAAEEWDELEKSIIAKLADDVVVGIKGRKVDIIVKKNLA